MESNDLIGTACQFAKVLERQNLSCPDGINALAMAIGIWVEGQDGSHREMLPLVDAALKVAQITFDALRAGRNREPGKA